MYSSRRADIVSATGILEVESINSPKEMSKSSQNSFLLTISELAVSVRIVTSCSMNSCGSRGELDQGHGVLYSCCGESWEAEGSFQYPVEALFVLAV